jgi:hypothetical protein
MCDTLCMCYVPTLWSPSAHRALLLNSRRKVSCQTPGFTASFLLTPPPCLVADQHAFNTAEMCSKKILFSSIPAPIISGRLRVGFVSVEMHDRPVGRDLINLFESLDVRLLDISCFCLYDLTPSKPRVQFEYRERLRAVRFSRTVFVTPPEY